jgi:hypothetical protein
MGCGYGQGFLVARPMAAPGVEALIGTGAFDSGAAGKASASDVSGSPKPGVPAV